MKQHTWRAARATCVIAVVVMVAAAVAVAGLVLITVRGIGHLGVVITLGVLALAGIVYLWRFALYPRVVLDERLTVLNPLRTHIIELDEPRSIEPGPNGLRITTDDGVVEAWCVQKSTGAIRANRPTRADEVATQISREIDRRLVAVRSAGVTIPDGPGLAPRSTDDSEPATVAADPGSDDPTVVETPEPGDDAVTTSESPVDDTADTAPEDTTDTASEDTTPEDAAPDDRTPDPDAAAIPAVVVAAGAGAAGAGAAAGHAVAVDPDDDTDDEDDDEDEDEDELIIRRAHRDELDVLVDLEETINTAALGAVFGADTPFPTTVVSDRWRSALSDRRIKVRIAEIGGRPIGYLSFDHSSIHQIGVLAAHTRQGHGSALLDYALTDIVRNGCTEPTLMVLEANHPARAFYQAQGWRDTGDREVCEHPPHPTEMKLVLDRAAG